ncbi:MAG: flagellar hook protein FlgE [Paracoccaceae bacterium]
MTLSSSLSAGIAGLQANATRLAVISDNVANASTTGYRRSDVDFSSLVLPSNGFSHAAGGVRAHTFRDVAGAGTLVSSSSATDLSVSGRGFLPVTTLQGVGQPAFERPFQLTATGSFERDAEGYLTTRSGLALMGWATNGDGTLPGNVVRDGPGDLVPVRVNDFLVNAQRTTEARVEVNLPAAATEAGADAQPFATVLEYFDGVGRRNELTARFAPTVPAAGAPPSNEWSVTIEDGATVPATVIGDLTVSFDAASGRIDTVGLPAIGTYTGADGTLRVTTTAGGEIDVFIGGAGLDGGLAQLDAGYAPLSIEANGAPAGNLAGIEVDAEGLLRGVYDTGARVALFKIPVVDVPNPNGLTALDGQSFAVSTEAGPPYLWDAGDGPVGTVQGFSLQESTVDIAQELTGLITTQRAYSSNATVIQTVDQMLQETTSLKR